MFAEGWPVVFRICSYESLLGQAVSPALENLGRCACSIMIRHLQSIVAQLLKEFSRRSSKYSPACTVRVILANTQGKDGIQVMELFAYGPSHILAYTLHTFSLSIIDRR